jgi:hypothetical protein
MGWPEERFEEIASARGPERAELVEQLVSDHRETGEWLHLDLKEVRGQPERTVRATSPKRSAASLTRTEA